MAFFGMTSPEEKYGVDILRPQIEVFNDAESSKSSARQRKVIKGELGLVGWRGAAVADSWLWSTTTFLVAVFGALPRLITTATG
jgi:hypothetical protein